MADDTDQDLRAQAIFILGQLYALTVVRKDVVEDAVAQLDDGHAELVAETGRVLARLGTR